MWYQLGRIKLAGADSVLQGAMPIKETIEETLKPFRYAYNLEGLPSDASIRSYFKTELPKIVRRMQSEVSLAEPDDRNKAVSTAIEQLSYAANFLKNTIRLYLASAKHQHLANVMYEELAKVAQVTQKFSPTATEYFYQPHNRKSSDSYYLSDLLGTGYNTLLNLEKLGLHLPAQFKFAVMSGMDVKSNPSLANDQFRPAMVEYIANKYPFYRRFMIQNGDDSTLSETVQSLANPTPEFLQEIFESLLPGEKAQVSPVWMQGEISSEATSRLMSSAIFGSGLPTTDLLKQLTATASYPSENVRCQESALGAQLENVNIRALNEVVDVIVATAAPNLPKGTLDKAVRSFLYSVPYTPSSGLTEESVQKLLQSPQVAQFISESWENRKDQTYLGDEDRFIKMGVAPWEDTLAYARRYPRAVSSIMGWADRRKELKTSAEVGQKEQDKALSDENAQTEERASLDKLKQKSENEKKPRHDIPTSLLHQQILDGNIDSATLSQAANGRYLEMAQQIGQSMRLSPEVVQKWADAVQLYTIKNNSFAEALAKSKAKNYDTVNDFSSALGLFTNGFSRDENPRERRPAIFLQSHMIKDQHDAMRIFQVLNVPSQASEDAVAAHEIAHALNFIATNGQMLKNIDSSGNKGRDYLTDYPEIVARVYGEIPMWRKVLHEQIDAMRETELVKEAVTEELTENTMTHEANVALGGIDPITEYERAKRLEHPYHLTDDPIKAANTRIERAKARVKDALYSMAQERRRDILLDILKKISSCKAQMAALAKAEQSTGEQDPTAQLEASEEMKKLKTLQVQAMNGGFDMEIESTVNGVIINFLTRNLAGMSEAVNNANWNPPATLLAPDGEPIEPELAEGTEPMGYHELKTLSDNDFAWSDGPKGGRTLGEYKNMEMYMPPHSPGYEENFNKNIVPKLTAVPQPIVAGRSWWKIAKEAVYARAS